MKNRLTESFNGWNMNESFLLKEIKRKRADLIQLSGTGFRQQALKININFCIQ